MIVVRSGRVRVRFRLLERKAPRTCAAFCIALPFSAKAVQARFAGEETWAPRGPALRVPAENASLRPRPGELGIAPAGRGGIARSIAIVYGNAKLAGRVNVFAAVLPQDRKKLTGLGEAIWLRGSRELRFSVG